MIILVQYVTSAQAKTNTASHMIAVGYVCLVAFTKTDTLQASLDFTSKLIKKRLIPDQNSRINLTIKQIDGHILWIPQFTLTADTTSGIRPSFDSCMPSLQASTLYKQTLDHLIKIHPNTKPGFFGQHMHLALTNQGPLTYILNSQT